MIYNVALLTFAYKLVGLGEQELAFKILALNVGLIAFAFLLSAAERKFSPKSHHFKGKRDHRDNRERSGNRKYAF